MFDIFKRSKEKNHLERFDRSILIAYNDTKRRFFKLSNDKNKRQQLHLCDYVLEYMPNSGKYHIFKDRMEGHHGAFNTLQDFKDYHDSRLNGLLLHDKLNDKELFKILREK